MPPSNFTEYIVPPHAAGQRLDVFIAGAAGLTRNAVQRLLEAGDIVRVASKDIPEKNYRVNPGDILRVNLPHPAPAAARPEDIPLDIIYEDDALIVINKPRGLVVHPAAGHFSGTLVNALLHHCRGGLSGIGGVERPGIVHRLDKDTSGLLVAAKTDAAHLSLSRQIAGRTMERIYHALCRGRIKQNTFTVNAPIGRHPKDRKKMAVRAVHTHASLPPGYRAAVTHFTVLQYIEAHALTCLEARLETGRTHQIRVHLAHAGYPVWGDTLYGSEKQSKISGYTPEGQMLHACRLSFAHPSDGRPMAFDAPPPWPVNFLYKAP